MVSLRRDAGRSSVGDKPLQLRIYQLRPCASTRLRNASIATISTDRMNAPALGSGTIDCTRGIVERLIVSAPPCARDAVAAVAIRRFGLARSKALACNASAASNWNAN